MIAIIIINLLLTLGLTWKVFTESKKPAFADIVDVEKVAKEITGQKIGVINVQKILSGSEAAASINKQVDALRMDFQKWVEEKEKILRDKEAVLVKAQPNLTEKEAAVKMEELRRSVEAFQHEAMEKKQKIEAATNEGVDKIKNTILGIANTISKQEGLTHVLADTFLVYFHESTDLTDKVLPALNKQLPNVKIEIKKEDKKQKQ